jgi:hypothetical protein
MPLASPPDVRWSSASPSISSTVDKRLPIRHRRDGAIIGVHFCFPMAAYGMADRRPRPKRKILTSKSSHRTMPTMSNGARQFPNARPTLAASTSSMSRRRRRAASRGLRSCGTDQSPMGSIRTFTAARFSGLQIRNLLKWWYAIVLTIISDDKNACGQDIDIDTGL